MQAQLAGALEPERPGLWDRQGRAAEVIALAQDIETAENRIRKAVEDGMRLDQARQQFKYFDLQRHQTKS